MKLRTRTVGGDGYARGLIRRRLRFPQTVRVRYISNRAVRASHQPMIPVRLPALQSAGMIKSFECFADVVRQRLCPNNITTLGSRIESHQLEVAVLRPSWCFQPFATVCFDDSNSVPVCVSRNSQVEHNQGLLVPS